MVEKLPERPESETCAEFSALLSTNSQRVGQVGDCSDLSIWMCGVNEHPNAIGYWIGCLPNFHAFLIVQPLTLGGRPTLEAIRGWVAPESRGQRLFSHLMRIAARKGQPLVGDRNGMTEKAHIAWKNASGFTRAYFDTETNQFVDEAKVPTEDQFTYWANGKRWLLVLDPEPEITNALPENT